MKILLIMPNFFNYPNEIKNELESIGHEVDFFDDRPSTNSIVKAIIRFKPSFINKYINKYFEKILQFSCIKKYDVVLLISGQSLSFDSSMLEKLRIELSEARFILYQWDSIKNYERIKSVHYLFDKKISFDREDSISNSDLEFLPLFYTSKYEKVAKCNKTEFKYDYCFIGTAHPKKYKFVKEIIENLKTIYSNEFIYFYFPSFLVYIYRKIINKEFKKSKLKEFNFIPLSSEQIYQIFCDSKCVLDSAQDCQTGLTMRVIEVIGARKKLITTNIDIENYDFYKKENIYIYKGEIDTNDVFFDSEYIDLDENIYQKYSLKNWVLKVLE